MYTEQYTVYTVAQDCRSTLNVLYLLYKIYISNEIFYGQKKSLCLQQLLTYLDCIL